MFEDNHFVIVVLKGAVCNTENQLETCSLHYEPIGGSVSPES